MTNTPRKLKDPTEAALSAIQDALSLRDSGPEQAGPNAAPQGSAAPLRVESTEDWSRAGRSAAPADHDLFSDGSSRTAEQIPGTPRRAAANDDRRSVGQLLQALQQRPSRGPYAVAFLFACFWIGL